MVAGTGGDRHDDGQVSWPASLTFVTSWLARLIQLQREQAGLTRRLLDRTPAPVPSST
jgi:hypothetical protein